MVLINIHMLYFIYDVIYLFDKKINLDLQTILRKELLHQIHNSLNSSSKVV